MAKRYLEIRAQMTAYMDSGKWPIGYKIPREMDLCAQFDVSRTTVRRALSALTEEGRLRRIKGTGTFVSRPQIFARTTFFIQSFAEELKSQGLCCETEVLECRYVSAEAQVAAALGLTVGTRVFKLRRLRYSKEQQEHGPIVLTASYFPAHVGALLESYDFEKHSLFSAMERYRIVRAHSEKSITATRLPPKECRLLSAKDEDLFLKVTSVCFDREERAVEYCESYFPTDRNTFRLHVVTD